jgi:hypothetical protein
MKPILQQKEKDKAKQAAEQEQFYKEEMRTILAENFRREEKEKIYQGSPNTIVYSPRTPTKSILKTSLNSAFAKPNKK